jgi:hypothetical protein
MKALAIAALRPAQLKYRSRLGGVIEVQLLVEDHDFKGTTELGSVFLLVVSEAPPADFSTCDPCHWLWLRDRLSARENSFF